MVSKSAEEPIKTAFSKYDSDGSATATPLCAVNGDYVAIFRDTKPNGSSDDTQQKNEPQFLNIFDAYGRTADCGTALSGELPQVANIPFPDATVTDIMFDPSENKGSRVFLRRERKGSMPLFYRVSWKSAGLLVSLCETWKALEEEFNGEPDGSTGENLNSEIKSRADDVCKRFVPPVD